MRSVPDTMAWFRANYKEAPPKAKVRNVPKRSVYEAYCKTYGDAALHYELFTREFTLAGFKTNDSEVTCWCGWLPIVPIVKALPPETPEMLARREATKATRREYAAKARAAKAARLAEKKAIVG